jgi:hypothetical protein
MVSDQTNPTPAGIAQLLHPLDHLGELGVNVAGQANAVLVAVVVQVSRLSPCASTRATRLMLVQRLYAVLAQ